MSILRIEEVFINIHIKPTNYAAQLTSTVMSCSKEALEYWKELQSYFSEKANKNYAYIRTKIFTGYTVNILEEATYSTYYTNTVITGINRNTDDFIALLQFANAVPGYRYKLLIKDGASLISYSGL